MNLSDFDFDNLETMSDSELRKWRDAAGTEIGPDITWQSVAVLISLYITVGIALYNSCCPEGTTKILSSLAFLGGLLLTFLAWLFVSNKPVTQLSDTEILTRRISKACHDELSSREAKRKEELEKSQGSVDANHDKEPQASSDIDKRLKEQQAVMREQRRKAQRAVEKHERKVGLRCPSCNSDKVRLIKNTASSLSAERAAIGAAAFGVEGAIVGAAMGKRGKRTYICCNCGKKYTVKN